VIEIYEGNHIDEDLDFIQSSPLYVAKDADLIRAFLEQIAISDEAKWSLIKWSALNPSPHFNESAIAWMQKAGYNLYRIRPLSKRLKQYRILYAYNGHVDEVYLLSIVVKKPETLPMNPPNTGYEYYDYETNHRITKRVIDEYAQLGLPKLQ